MKKASQRASQRGQDVFCQFSILNIHGLAARVTRQTHGLEARATLRTLYDGFILFQWSLAVDALLGKSQLLGGVSGVRAAAAVGGAEKFTVYGSRFTVSSKFNVQCSGFTVEAEQREAKDSRACIVNFPSENSQAN